ncbi:PrsW family intramembrane metalloprotease [Streptosporangium sp. NPDC002721]|uniref:PrsW family intramembrane metalloprotease n=1 Tax=Streptosporangium sp. NPDC002721 TaxID=3366188 RepID=UPI0036CD3A7B
MDTHETAAPPGQGGRSRVLPPRPGRGLIAALAVSGICVLIAMGIVLANGGPAGFGVSFALGLAPLPILLAAVLALDRLEPEPRLNLLFAFAWGAGIAVVLGVVLELGGTLVLVRAFDVGERAAETVTLVAVAPVVEEALKGAALLWLIWRCRREIDGPTDGIIYASMVGLGFAAVENMVYYSAAFTEAGTEGAVGLFVLRGLVSPLGHPLFTSMIGLGVAYAVTSRRRGAFLAVPLGYLGAVLLHGLWNGTSALDSLPALGAAYLLELVVICALVVVTVRERRRLVAMMSVYLPAYLPTGLVTPYDIGMLGSLGTRRQARRWARGIGAGRAMSDYQQAATELVMLHQRAERDGTAPGNPGGLGNPGDLGGLAAERDALLAVMARSRESFVPRSPSQRQPA